MPYIPPNKRKKIPGQLVGSYDKKPISRKYEMQVSSNRKRLLENETPAERAFREIAEEIRDVYNVPFGGQRVFHITDLVAFVADFYFKKFHLAVEIDGASHYRPKERERDAWRSKLLEENEEIEIIRFSNSEVLGAPEIVKQKLIDALMNAKRATPSYQKELRRRVERERQSSLADFDRTLDRNL